MKALRPGWSLMMTPPGSLVDPVAVAVSPISSDTGVMRTGTIKNGVAWPVHDPPCCIVPRVKFPDPSSAEPTDFAGIAQE